MLHRFLASAAFVLLVWAASPAQSAQPPAKPARLQVNLLVVGDVGYKPDPTPSPNTAAVAKALAEYVRASSDRFDAVLLLGDSFKVSLRSTGDDYFRKGFEQMYDPRILSMPFYPILGNHDYDSSSSTELRYSLRHPDSRWKMPARWYRVDLPADSPLLTILMLDSNKGNVSSSDWKTQIKWLESQLAAPHAPWTICCAHKPAFSDGQHGDSGTIKTEFGPLLKKYNVDFYLSGHDHVLEHQQPDGWKTTFIISGGGGENTVRPVSGHKSVFSAATPGFVHLQFSADSAHASFLNPKLDVLHSFQKSKE